MASKDTANLIERSIDAVERGTQIANSTAESLEQVVKDVRATSEKVDNIANASMEQASAVEQVTLGVDQIFIPKGNVSKNSSDWNKGRIDL